MQICFLMLAPVMNGGPQNIPAIVKSFRAFPTFLPLYIINTQALTATLNFLRFSHDLLKFKELARVKVYSGVMILSEAPVGCPCKNNGET
jgi:hypothetical protein